MSKAKTAARPTKAATATPAQASMTDAELIARIREYEAATTEEDRLDDALDAAEDADADFDLPQMGAASERLQAASDRRWKAAEDILSELWARQSAAGNVESYSVAVDGRVYFAARKSLNSDCEPRFRLESLAPVQLTGA